MVESKSVGGESATCPYTALHVQAAEANISISFLFERLPMRRLCLCLILVLFVAPALLADTIFPYKYQETVLENGLKIILIPMKNEGL
ncbi:MAG TPA: hypothetical protein VJ044_06540, partial [Candidatus Hodarchaeales archaeon]|nr:hypothetical protein [Candidatus Hodarchaeales archaeon]